MNPLVTNCLASVAYGKQILADIEDQRMAERPLNLNPPAWLLMHLASAADYAAALLGGQGVCPADWKDRADTKKPVSSNRADYPSHADLLKYFESSYQHAADLLSKATPEQLAAPQKLGFFEQELPTVADMAGFLLVAHLAIHLGQISAWRRATGKAPLF
jgi:DinB superfamily